MYWVTKSSFEFSIRYYGKPELTFWPAQQTTGSFQARLRRGEGGITAELGDHAGPSTESAKSHSHAFYF